MACASRLYPRAKPRGFTLHWIKNALYRAFLDQIIAERTSAPRSYRAEFLPTP